MKTPDTILFREFVTVPLDRRVRSASADSSLWFACFAGGISRFDGRRWQTYMADLSGTFIFVPWQTKDSTVWAGGTVIEPGKAWNGVFWRFDGNRWKAYSLSEILQSPIVHLAGQLTRRWI